MDIMISFSYIYIVWITICVESEITVSGQVGSTAVLPCQLQPVGTEIQHIRWLTESETVFERAGEDSYQAEGYEGRVDVPEEELRKGNCSLVLLNLTLTDAGVYTSYQIVRRSKRSVMIKAEEISRVKLSVYEETEKPPEKKTEIPRDDAGMKCPHPLIMVLSLISCLLLQFFFT